MKERRLPDILMFLQFILFLVCFWISLSFPVATKVTKFWLSQDKLEDSAGSKSQLSEKSPLEPLDDEVEEAPLTPLDLEVPSKPAEPLPLEDLGIAQSEPSSESGMFLLINILYSMVLSFFCDLLKFRIPFQSNYVTSLETKWLPILLILQLVGPGISRIV